MSHEEQEHLPPEDVDERFVRYCEEHGITILRVLQHGRRMIDICSSVFLVLDTDGLIKIYKEVARYGKQTYRDLRDTEESLYQELGPISGIPLYYGTTDIDDEVSFLRMSYCYGQELIEYVTPTNLLRPDEARFVTLRLAQTLTELHARNIAYLDLRPQNVKVNGDEVTLLDLGDARRIPKTGFVLTHPHDPRYIPPEVHEKREATTASDVFQLGILFYELLTGEHPSLPFAECVMSDEKTSLLLKRMLATDPLARPSMREIAEVLAPESAAHIIHRGRKAHSPSNGYVFFPARMGVLHRGHVDFMARLLELGYQLIVSIEMSYMLVETDPVPKWLILKMIAESLRQKGFDPNQIEFFCSPLCANDTQRRMRYAHMPHMNEVVAVASGNPLVHESFDDQFPIIDQRTVFGHEGEAYETRSWGARLRRAIRTNDQATYRDLVASGVESILSFAELQRYCACEEPIEFVWGHPDWGSVIAIVVNEQGEPLVRRRVGSYQTPEEAVAVALEATLTDRFARESRILLKETAHRLVFERVELDEHKNELIHYRLLLQ